MYSFNRVSPLAWSTGSPDSPIAIKTQQSPHSDHLKMNTLITLLFGLASSLPNAQYDQASSDLNYGPTNDQVFYISH